MAKPFWQIVKELGILVGILVIAFFILDKTTSIFKSAPKNQSPTMVNVPDKSQDFPDATGGQEDPKITDLIKQPYQSRNVYDPKIYKEDSINIALKGDFEDAMLYVETNIENDVENFLYLGFGTLNGTWGVDRLDGNRITYDLDTDFTKKDNSRSIDLMNDIRLSNNSRDVEKGLGGSKFRTPWNYIQPPATKENASLVNVVASLYDETGVWGSQIIKMQILYHCADTDPNCRVDVCKKGLVGSACLDSIFGKGSGTNYGKFFSSKK